MSIYLNPSVPAVHTNRAAAYLKASMWVDAEMDCTAALDLHPTANLAVKALMRRSAARIELKRYSEALEDVDAALEMVRCLCVYLQLGFFSSSLFLVFVGFVTFVLFNEPFNERFSYS